MSEEVFPTLPGLTYSVVKSTNWATRFQRSVSGIERRTTDYNNPIWNFTLILSLLRDFPYGSYDPVTELRTLMDFYNSRQGAFDTFLYTDLSDDRVMTQQIGVGDGTNLIFQLVRQLTPGGFIENIIAPNAIENLYDNGTPISSADYTVNFDTGVVTFGAGHAPAATHIITWTGTFYFRVRFTNDNMDFEEFYHNFWELKQLKLTSIVL